MAKMDWDKINIENLDYRHKKEIERKEEEKALLADSSGSPTLHPCPHCELSFSAERYRFHFVEAHFFTTGSVSIVTLLAKIGNDVLFFSAIPACVFDDVLESLQSNFDFKQDYSPGELMEKLPREARRLMVEAWLIRLSGRRESDVEEIAQVHKDMVKRIGRIVRRKNISFKEVRLEGSFVTELRKALRRRKKRRISQSRSQ